MFFLFLRFVVERETNASFLDFKAQGIISSGKKRLNKLEPKLSMKQCKKVLQVIHKKNQNSIENALNRLNKQVIKNIVIFTNLPKEKNNVGQWAIPVYTFLRNILDDHCLNKTVKKFNERECDKQFSHVNMKD